MALINGDFLLVKYGWEKCKCVNYENVSIIPYSMIILTLIYTEKGNKNSKSIILEEWLLAFSITIIIIPYSRRANLLLEGK